MFRSENAGMSSDNPGENPGGRKSKVSPTMFVSRGLVGPKGSRPPMAGGYLDGGVVEIRLHGKVRYYLRITRMEKSGPPNEHGGSKPQSSFGWKNRRNVLTEW